MQEEKEPQRKLYRQINPNWILPDRVASIAFLPTDKDNGFLSVYNSIYFTPKEAYEHFIKDGLISVKVLSVTVKNCQDEGLPVVDDNFPFTGHSSINFNSIESTNGRKRIAKSLSKKAILVYEPK